MLKQSKDSNRMTDLQTINKALSILETQGVSNFGSSNTVYVSIPDTSATCANLGLPSLPTGWNYSCVASSTLSKVDSTGWIPVNFSQTTIGAPLSSLPIDPVNTTTTGNYYTYTPGGSWKLTSLFESEKYSRKMNTDGGPDVGIYEIGSDLNLANFQRGLVGYWKFDESSGTLYDSSGRGNNGTQSGSVIYGAAGKISSALSFDRSDDYIDIGSDSSLNLSIFSYSFWMKPSYLVQGSIIGGFNNSNYTKNWARISSSKIGIDQYPPSGAQISNTILSANWYHVVLIQDGANQSLYLNGVLDWSISNAEAYTGSVPEKWTIGRREYYPTNYTYFGGSLDDVRVYNRALSASEIQAIYNATK
ncbi:LamG domain-containing protein [Candidatus Wolfebacteria bacterium]|nr:LamG domain-containing protein [Candidatus Wolfebacteria bacterium]